ncbi:hypothetical protein [Pseudomonas fluorescens]|nr:hypothetical protein [Pseudomonas fluorescens]
MLQVGKWGTDHVVNGGQTTFRKCSENVVCPRFTLQFHEKVYMLCPRCQQDYIVKAKIKVTEAVIFTCPECDATWFKIEEIGVVPFLDYATYMNSIGLTGMWEELEIIAERI